MRSCPGPSDRLILATLLLCFAAPAALCAQCLPTANERKLTGSQSEAWDRYGEAIDLQGDLLVIGAADDSLLAQVSGAVYVLERTGAEWTETAILRPGDPADVMRFGASVATDGSWIVVGAPGDSEAAPDAGAVYLFRDEGSGWVQHRKLLPPEPIPGAYFGNSMAIEGDRLLVGAYLAEGAEISSGAAWTFLWSGAAWVEEQKLINPAGLDGDGFGDAVALSGDLAVIGAPHESPGAPEVEYTGAAYAFHREPAGWVLEARLEAPDPQQLDYVGRRISAGAGRVAVGLPFRAVTRPGSGAVYLFDRDGGAWSGPPVLLQPGDTSDSGGFGSAVDLNGDRIAVGADHAHRGIPYARGALYLFAFEGGTWEEEAFVRSGPSVGSVMMGSNVRYQPGILAVGAKEVDHARGAVHVFRCPEDVCTGGIDEDEDTMVDCDDADCVYSGDCDQEDWDGDGAPNDDDCLPLDDSAHAVPEEIRRISVEKWGPECGALLRWQAVPPAGSATFYQVASRPLEELPAEGASDPICRGQTVFPQFLDSLNPSQKTWYLVRAVNPCGPPAGEGWGTDSGGSPRPGCP